MTFDPQNPTCIECDEPAELVGGDAIYPHRPDLHHKSFWLCQPCEAYCGCHPGTTNSLGFPAGPETRNARSYVHRVLDPIWKNAGQAYEGGGPKHVRSMARSRVYGFLASEMGISKNACHTGMFSIAQCRQAYAILKKTDYARVRAWVKSKKPQKESVKS